LKVVFASEFFGSNAAAFTRRIAGLAGEFALAGRDVMVITPQPSMDSGGSMPFRLLRLRSASAVKSRPGTPMSRIFSNMLFALRFIRIMRSERPEHTVVSFHDSFRSLMIVTIAKMAGSKTVFDGQDTWLILSETHTGATRNRIRKSLEKWAMGIADSVTTVSGSLKDMIAEEYGIAADRIHVVYNGANPPPKPPQMAKDIDLIHNGSPRVYYDTIAFVEALSRVTASGLHPSAVFLGCRDDSYVAQVKEKVKSLGLENDVRFLPPVPHESVAEWLARSRIGVYTMTSERPFNVAMGVKIFEYMASGVPVVYMGPQDSELSTFIAASGCGLTAPTSVGLAMAIEELLRNETKRQEMARKALETAKSYSWRESARALEVAMGISATS